MSNSGYGGSWGGGASRALLIVSFAAVLVFGPAGTASADLGRGLQRLVAGVLQVPVQTLAGTFTGPPVIGTLVGAARGVVQGVAMTATGAVEVGMSGLAIGKSVAPLVLPFLL